MMTLQVMLLDMHQGRPLATSDHLHQRVMLHWLPRETQPMTPHVMLLNLHLLTSRDKDYQLEQVTFQLPLWRHALPLRASPRAAPQAMHPYLPQVLLMNF